MYLFIVSVIFADFVVKEIIVNTLLVLKLDIAPQYHVWRQNCMGLFIIMAVTIGTIQEFDDEVELVTAYLEQVQLFMDANTIANEKKVAVFLSLIGSKAYEVLRNILGPEKPTSKSYEELRKVLKQHYEPQPVINAERFYFLQALGESCTTYTAEL